MSTLKNPQPYEVKLPRGWQWHYNENTGCWCACRNKHAHIEGRMKAVWAAQGVMWDTCDEPYPANVAVAVLRVNGYQI
jgi:hypothetical protein